MVKHRLYARTTLESVLCFCSFADSFPLTLFGFSFYLNLPSDILQFLLNAEINWLSAPPSPQPPPLAKWGFRRGIRSGRKVRHRVPIVWKYFFSRRRWRRWWLQATRAQLRCSSRSSRRSKIRYLRRQVSGTKGEQFLTGTRKDTRKLLIDFRMTTIRKLT